MSLLARWRSARYLLPLLVNKRLNMGIRLHKQMGWGIMLPSPPGVLESEELNSLSFADYCRFVADKHPDSDDFTNMDAFFYRQVTTVESIPEEMRTWRPWKTFQWVEDNLDEYPNGSGLLVLTPPLMTKEWRRTDDSMDAVELEVEYAGRPEQELLETKVSWLERNPYPFGGNYMDKRGNSDKSITEVLRVVRSLVRNAQTNDYSGMLDEAFYENLHSIFDEEKLQDFFTKHGYEDLNDFVQNTAPNVPHEVRDICEWLNILPHEQVLQLRPVLVRWFS